jgi:hypothetical protein
MGDLRPLGSEKLQGMDKIRRIMEIANYNEVSKQDTNDLSTTNYTIQLADGNTYGIVKERLGYIIKKGLNESTLEYTESIKQRKYYKSYSDVMKRLNLVAGELNRIHENSEGIALIGEQEGKKRFTLKTPKAPVDIAPTPAPVETTPPPAPESTPTPPTPEEPMMDDVPNSEMEEPMNDMGTEEPMDDMGTEEPMDDMGNDENEPTGMKTIQKLTGKLSQKLRAFGKDKGMDSQDIKYVLNSIISALDLESLDEDDKDDILSKFDESDEYGEEGPGELDLSSDEEFGMDSEESMDEPEMEPETKEGYQSVMDSLFSESAVESVLTKYFDVKPSEKPLLEEKETKNFIKNKIKNIEIKNEIIAMSESLDQRINSLVFLKENVNAKFVGKTNKANLIFTIDGKQVKITPKGDII